MAHLLPLSVSLSLCLSLPFISHGQLTQLVSKASPHVLRMT